jgi:hypothetical protein
MSNRNMKKVLNITTPQGNATQSHKEIASHPSKNGYCQRHKITSVGEFVEKRNICTLLMICIKVP